MKRNILRVLVPVAALCVILLAASPAKALFPEGWSFAWQDVTGGIVECVDFISCGQASCPAVALAAASTGQYENVTGDFETGRTRTTVKFSRIFWAPAGFFGPTRQVILDVTCSRLGFGLWTFVGLNGAPASCGAEATLKGHFFFGNINESYSAVTLDQGVTCVDFFGGPDGPNGPIEKTLHRRLR